MVEINDVKALYVQAVTDFENVKKRQSNIDHLEQDILHYIELGNYNAAQGSQLVKKLKETRRTRRKVKNQREELGIVVDRLKSANIEKIKHTPCKAYAKPLDVILNAKA